jgi:sulfite exporter TauE/SafE
MLASITPLGERGRHSRWGVTMAAFLIGGAGGGVLAGGALGAAGASLSAVLDRFGLGHAPVAPVLAVAAVTLVAAAFDLRLLSLGLPTVHRQVDERWLQRYRGWVYGVGFGFQLGLGVVTIVVTAALYAAFAAAFLTGSVAAGALIGVVFGLTRSATLLSVARVRRPDQLVTLGRRLRRFEPAARRSTAVLQVGLAAAALAIATGALP